MRDRADGLSRAGLALAAAALLAAAGAADAQNLVIATAPSTPPISNAATRGLPSSVSFLATNVRAGAVLTRLQLRLPNGYQVSGGAGPAGWVVASITNTNRTITFEVSDCAVGGLATGQAGTFRVDAAAPTTAIGWDQTDALASVSGTDRCFGASGWSETNAGNVTWPRKALRITGSVSPASGAAPLAATATYTVTNLSFWTRTVSLSPTVSPAAGWTGGTCAPASLSLAAGAEGTFTCAYQFTAAGAYAVGATATGSSVSAAGVWAGTVLVGDTTATFAFDSRVALPGDRVQATLTVRNAGDADVTATPPTHGQLGLSHLTPAPGAADPTPAVVPAGGSARFDYALDVTGAVGDAYVASGSASISIGGSPAGETNVAVTPAGTISSSRVSWTPPGVVRSRTAAPYRFTVDLTNGSSVAVSEVRIVNPQNGTWTGLANVSAAGLTYAGRNSSGTTTYLRYTGALAPGATATLTFSFTAVPAVTQTTTYAFQVVAYRNGTASFHPATAAVVVPIPDVGLPGVLSLPDRQVLTWTNTSRADAAHDGVVVFRAPAGTAPTVPADFVDYTEPANQPADLFHADGAGSLTTSLADLEPGVFNYRICNRDALLVYSSCNTGFWNGAGYLDSTPPPDGGWAHQLGGTALLLPGVAPGGRLGVTTNAPSVAVLDLATGERSQDPVPLGAIPANGSPAARVAAGLLLFAADGGGTVRGIALEAGATGWTRALAGESFVAGPYVLPRQYAAPAFQAAYARDVAFVGSTTGRVFALDASTGAQLWQVNTGVTNGVRARPLYDAGTNRLYVPTNGGGVLAYALDGSSATQAPALAIGWTNPSPTGTFRLACRPATTTELVCADTSGTVRVVDKVTGAVTGSVTTQATSPSTIARVNGTSPGYVVSNASRVVRVVPIATAPYLAVGGQWAPGLTLSPALALNDEQAIIVGASDRRLHRLSLADASDTGASVQITSPATSLLVGPPAVDVVNGRLVFGTEDGRVWAVPPF